MQNGAKVLKNHGNLEWCKRGASSTVDDEKEKNTIGGDPKIWQKKRLPNLQVVMLQPAELFRAKPSAEEACTTPALGAFTSRSIFIAEIVATSAAGCCEGCARQHTKVVSNEAYVTVSLSAQHLWCS